MVGDFGLYQNERLSFPKTGAFGEDEDHFESYYVVAVAIPGIKEQGSCQVCQGFQSKVNFSKWLHGSGSGCRISSFFRSGEPR